MRSSWGGMVPGSGRAVVALVVATMVLAAACGGESAAGSDESDRSAGDEDAGTEDAGTEDAGTEVPAGEQGVEEGKAVPSPGCDSPSGEPAVKGRRAIQVADEERWYLLTAPGTAVGSEPVPLVFDLHGLSEGAEFHANSTGWSELAEEEGFVAVFPNGSGRTLGWNIASSGPNPDLDFIDAVLDTLGDEYCIDESRVYSTGLSNGAFMSSVLACTRSEKFAAVAPVAGVVRPPDCAAEGAVPVMAFHGTADPLLPFNGSVSADLLDQVFGDSDGVTTTVAPGDLDGEGYPHSASQWASANGCGDPSDERVGESVVKRSWDCPDGAEVVFYMIEGGGHTWPGSDGLTNEAIAEMVGPTTFEIDATQLAWEFFSSQRLAA